jgi:hypothetical protein
MKWLVPIEKYLVSDLLRNEKKETKLLFLITIVIIAI